MASDAPQKDLQLAARHEVYLLSVRKMPNISGLTLVQKKLNSVGKHRRQSNHLDLLTPTGTFDWPVNM